MTREFIAVSKYILYLFLSDPSPIIGNACREIVKSLSRLESNSLTFLQLVKAVKTSTDGATGSMFYFDFSCTMNFPFPFLMEPLDPKPPEEALYLRV